MMHLFRCARAIAFLGLVLGAPGLAAGGPGAKARRLILFIGDGVGVAQWQVAHLARPDLAVRRMPVTGLVDVASASGPVTDSAASATAYATGTATLNKAIGVGPDGVAYCNLLERARASGAATGVVTTQSVIDATPAAFLAHARSRSEVGAIARQAAESGVTVLFGGGRDAFSAANGCEGCLDRLRGRAWLIDGKQGLAELPRKGDARPVVALLAPDAMEPAARRDISLAELTRAALAVLDARAKDFVLVVEGALTDDLSHQRASIDLLEAELLDFDGAISQGLAYQARRGDTLVLVVSDHETGGLALVPGQGPHGLDARYVVPPGGEDSPHSAQWVPLFASGPGAAEVSGLHTNAEIGRLLMRSVLGPVRAAEACTVTGAPPPAPAEPRRAR